MADTPNGDGSAFNFDRKLDRINDALASMSLLMQEHLRVVLQSHRVFMEEVQSLLDLQKEQRIDIMALFHMNKQMENILEKIVKPDDRV